jgi:2-oxoglutarate ferredoxin oxidoreductase subunit beta
MRTTTTPYQNVEHAFRAADVVAASGASYVARWTTYHVFQLMESMQNAIRKKGFSFIEIISQCPVSYGKMTGMSDPVDLLKFLRDNSVHVDEARGVPEKDLAGKFVIGKLVERDLAEFVQGLRHLNEERKGRILHDLAQGRIKDDTSAMETGR